jgi:hypothetical protein
VAARGNPWDHRAGKFARRHKAKLAAATAALLALAALAGWAVVERARAVGERNEAVHARDQAYQRSVQARQAVDDYSLKVSKDPRLANFPRLRRELLLGVVPFYERLTEGRGGDPRDRAEPGRVYMGLGFLMQEIDDPARVATWYERARDCFARLTAEDPEDAGHLGALADCQNALGHAYRQTWRLTEAEQASLHALRLSAGLAERHPDVPRHQDRLARSHQGLGAGYRARGELVNAERALQVGPGYRGGPRPGPGGGPRPRRGRGAGLGRGGLPGDPLYNLAWICTLSAAAAAKDGALPQAERERLAERHAAAVGLLHRARAAGFFKDPGAVAHVKKDKELDPLRPRADFQALLAELDGKPKPDAPRPSPKRPAASEKP